MVSKVARCGGAIALLVVIAVLGYYLASSGSGSSSSSNQANGGSSGLPTTTVRLGCPSDGDADGEAVISQTTTYTSSGTVTVQKGACVLDSDGDGR